MTRRFAKAILVLCIIAVAGEAWRIGAIDGHAAGRATRGKSGSYRPGEIILKFDGTPAGLAVAALKGRLNAVALRRFSDGAEHWRIGPGLDVETAVEIARRHPGVRYVEPNYLVDLDTTIPDDTHFTQQWSLRNTGQATTCAVAGAAGADVGATTAWDLQTGDAGVMVAVIDTGVDYYHPDLAANIAPPADRHDFADDDGDPMPDRMCTGSGHGTHVAGILGAVGNNAAGVTGVNWAVRIMPLKIFPNSGGLQNCNHADVAAAVEAIDHAVSRQVAAISGSWGLGAFSQALYDAIARAEAAGILYFCGAGNGNGTNIDRTPHYPASFAAGVTVPPDPNIVPLENVVVSGNTNSSDALDGTSNIGPAAVALGAPGRGILSTLPRIPDPNCDPNSEDDCLFVAQYGCSSGTSMATPHAAGAAALLRAQSPGASMSRIKCALLAAADPRPSLYFKTFTWGRLNLGAALDLVSSGQPCPSGFRMKKTIGGSGNTNLIGLPYTNPYEGAGGPEQLCQVFGLPAGSTIEQYDGSKSGPPPTHTCGTTPTFQLLHHTGVIVRTPDAGVRTGLVEGSDDPAEVVDITIYRLGGGGRGTNLVPVRHNGSARTPQDLCNQCGLSSLADITRYDGVSGLIYTHVCGQAVQWSLVPGEAVLVREPDGSNTKTCSLAKL